MPLERKVSLAILVISAAVLGSAVVLPGTIGVGLGLMFASLLLLGLSFIPHPASGPDAPVPLSQVEGITRIFYAPSRVFHNLRAHPRWMAAFAVIALCTTVYSLAFTHRITHQRIAEAKAERLLASGWLPQAQKARIREERLKAAESHVARVSGVASQVVGIFVFLVISAALYLVGIILLGGRINFWQSLSATAYAALPPSVIQTAVSLILLYSLSPDKINPIKGQQGLIQDHLGLLFNPATRPFLYTAASYVGLLVGYRVWLSATGLTRAGERVSTGIAWTTILTLGVLRVLLALAVVALFPGFVS